MNSEQQKTSKKYLKRVLGIKERPNPCKSLSEEINEIVDESTKNLVSENIRSPIELVEEDLRPGVTRKIPKLE